MWTVQLVPTLISKCVHRPITRVRLHVQRATLSGQGVGSVDLVLDAIRAYPLMFLTQGTVSNHASLAATTSVTVPGVVARQTVLQPLTI